MSIAFAQIYSQMFHEIKILNSKFYETIDVYAGKSLSVAHGDTPNGACNEKGLSQTHHDHAFDPVRSLIRYRTLRSKQP